MLISQLTYAQKDSIQFTGSDLKSQIVVAKIYKKLQEKEVFSIDLEKFKKELNLLGYFNHQVEIINDTTHLVNVKNRIERIKITLNPSVFANLSRLEFLNISNNILLVPVQKLEYVLNTIKEHYKSQGYSFVRVSLTRIKKDNSNIKAELLITKKNKRVISEIVLNGYEKFPYSFISNKLQIDKGVVFNQSALQNTSELMKQIPFASEIRKPEVLFTEEKTAIYLYLKKEKNNHFDGLVGISNNNEAGGVALHGFLDLLIMNAFNKGEVLEFNWRKTNQESQGLSIRAEYPYILHSPISTSFQLKMHKKDSSYVNVTNKVNITYKIKQNTKTGVIVESTTSNNVKNIEANYSNYFYGVSFKHFKPSNDLIFKTKYSIETNVLQGKRNGEEQTKIHTHFLYNIKINTRQNLNIQNTTALLYSNVYKSNELFLLGGANSIRGFNDDSFSANAYSYINVTYSYATEETSYLSILTDWGLLQTVFFKKPIPVYSLGLGYTFNTKNGKIGLQYAIGNTTKEEFNLNSSKLHISLNKIF